MLCGVTVSRYRDGGLRNAAHRLPLTLELELGRYSPLGADIPWISLPSFFGAPRFHSGTPVSAPPDER